MPDTSRYFLKAPLLAFALLLTLLAAAPQAQAAGDDVNLSLCKQVLSRILCKKVNEFNYMGKVQDGVYIISVFYASKNSEFLCAVMPDGQLIVQDRTWHPMRRVIPYTADSDGKCLNATLSSPECPARAAIKACPTKTPGDVKEQIRETFWVRPIPAILEEEYRSMTEKQQNSTAPAPPAPAAPGK